MNENPTTRELQEERITSLLRITSAKFQTAETKAVNEITVAKINKILNNKDEKNI